MDTTLQQIATVNSDELAVASRGHGRAIAYRTHHSAHGHLGNRPLAMCTLRQRICSVGRGAAHRTWRRSHPPAVELATSWPEDVVSIRPIRRSLAKARASCWRRSCRATRCLPPSPALASERGPTLLSQGQIALALDNQLRSPRRNCGRDRSRAAVACRARPHVAFVTFGVTE